MIKNYIRNYFSDKNRHSLIALLNQFQRVGRIDDAARILAPGDVAALLTAEEILEYFPAEYVGLYLELEDMAALGLIPEDIGSAMYDLERGYGDQLFPNKYLSQAIQHTLVYYPDQGYGPYDKIARFSKGIERNAVLENFAFNLLLQRRREPICKFLEVCYERKINISSQLEGLLFDIIREQTQEGMRHRSAECIYAMLLLAREEIAQEEEFIDLLIQRAYRGNILFRREKITAARILNQKKPERAIGRMNIILTHNLEEPSYGSNTPLIIECIRFLKNFMSVEEVAEIIGATKIHPSNEKKLKEIEAALNED